MPPPPTPLVAILTAGRDKPYALGLAAEWMRRGIPMDFIGSDEVDAPELHGSPLVRFLNLRGDQSTNAGALKKMCRVLRYYFRLLTYAVTSKAKVFHILWHNKFDFLDRTVVMAFYRLLGKRLVFTAHNVNAGKRDGIDTFWNRISLKSQYALADHIFVHTEMMKQELMHEFHVPGSKISVIPFGINNTLPNSALTPAAARQKLGLGAQEKTLLFFGNIAPYKGLEHLVSAFIDLHKPSPLSPLPSAPCPPPSALHPPSFALTSSPSAPSDLRLPSSVVGVFLGSRPFPSALSPLPSSPSDYRLIIAGRPKGSEEYWAGIHRQLEQADVRNDVIEKIDYIPDEEVEIYFKAADLLVLPYLSIFQSGVLFLGYSFGVPVLATNVGSLKEEIVIGKTGLICPPSNPEALAASIKEYFRGDLYRNLDQRRTEIRQYANERYSWAKVGAITEKVYSQW